MRRLSIFALVGCALVLSACSEENGQGDPLQVVENPVAATPAPSPQQSKTPAGTVLPAPGEATAVTVDPKAQVLAVATNGSDHPEMLFYALDDLSTKPTRVQVPGAVEQVMTVRGNQVAATIPSENLLVYLSPDDGMVDQTRIEGAPVSVAGSGSQQLVALRDAEAVAVLEHEQRTMTISGEIQSADQVLTVGDNAVVLDRLRSALFELNLDDATIGLGLRAGDGATNAIADGFGRVLVTDTRTDGLLAFSLDPLLLRQRYPVAGGIYGIAYDSERDLAWVTLTERNEVVGFDVAGGEPEEKMRFATVRQPNSVTVDESAGRVIVASAAGEGIQVIEP